MTPISSSQSSSLDRIVSYVMGVFATLVASVGGLRLLEDYARVEDFLLYRLSFNFSEGKGLVYNPSEKALPTLSPLPALLIGLLRSLVNQVKTIPQSYTPLFASVVFVIGYGMVATILYHRLRKSEFEREEIVFITFAWLAAFPLWAGIKSPAPYTLFLILLGLHIGEKGQWRLAGLLAGLSVLVQPEGALGCVVLGLYVITQEQGWRFWYVVWLPIAAWLVLGAFYYTDAYWSGLILIGEPVTTSSTAQSLLWIALFMGAVGIAYQVGIKGWVWILYLWGALEVMGRVVVFGELTQIQSLPLVLGIGVSIVLVVRHLKLSPRGSLAAFGSGVVILAIITVLAPPQTEESLALDIELSNTIGIPKDTSVLHDRSDGIIRYLGEFTGDIYDSDGTRSLFVSDFVERGDYESLIIAIAPDVIYFNAEDGELADLDLRTETLRPLNYQKTIEVRIDPGQREGDEFWTRRATVGEFGDMQDVELNFGPDVRLTGYALDRSRPQAGEMVRIRLDWSLDRPPTSTITVQLSLLDNEGNPVVSIFPIFERETWERLDLSTYHALAIPEEALPGRLRIQAALDYKAAIIGENEVGSLVVAAPQPGRLPEAEGQIGDVVLYDSVVTPTEGGLEIDLVWGVQEQLERDYQVLVHFTPLDDIQPLANGDGPPVNGRFPTSEWVAGELVPDTHFLRLTDIGPGIYRVNVGFYILETFERLRDDARDSLTIARVQIGEDGTVTILPPIRKLFG